MTCLSAVLLTFSYVNLCWVIGQFIASGVLVGVQDRSDEWGWRIPYAIQWVWPLPIIAVCLLCPESPTWRKFSNVIVAEQVSCPTWSGGQSRARNRKIAVFDRRGRDSYTCSISSPSGPDQRHRKAHDRRSWLFRVLQGNQSQANGDYRRNMGHAADVWTCPPGEFDMEATLSRDRPTQFTSSNKPVYPPRRLSV
jgi:hypothetical protein